MGAWGLRLKTGGHSRQRCRERTAAPAVGHVVPPADEGNREKTSRVTYDIEPVKDSVIPEE